MATSVLNDLSAALAEASLVGSVEVLVLSRPNTSSALRAVSARIPELSVTVIDATQWSIGARHMLAVEHARQHQWELIAFVPGDAVPIAATIDRLLAPILDGRADAVVGARRRSGGGRGWSSDSALSWISRADVTDWHSPFRAYRLAALVGIGTLLGDSDAFDVQVLLRLLAADRSVVEVAVDEVGERNGASLRTNMDGLVDASRAALGRRGFGRGDFGHTPDVYEFKPSEHSSHSEILDLVPPSPQLRILDVGCGAGFLGEQLRKQGHVVVGIDIVDSPDVRTRVDVFYRCDLDHGLVDDVGDGFDLIVAADVIEHVREPDLLLTSLRARLAPGGSLIASVPNFAHWYPRTRTALGLFDYDQRGILDRGHVRLFTLRSFRRLAVRSGFELTGERSTGLPLDALRIRTDRGFGRAVARVDSWSTVVSKTLFSYQFVFTMVPGAAKAVGDLGDHDS